MHVSRHPRTVTAAILILACLGLRPLPGASPAGGGPNEPNGANQQNTQGQPSQQEQASPQAQPGAQSQPAAPNRPSEPSQPAGPNEPNEAKVMPAPQVQAPPAVREKEAEVLSAMHLINEMEIRAGQLAKEKGATWRIREYGERLMGDHKMGDAMVKAFAKRHAITLEPLAKLPAAQQEQMQKTTSALDDLENKSGPVFDQGFLELTASGHKGAITMLGKARQNLKGEPLAELIGTLLPILQQHYTIAVTLDIRTLAQGGFMQQTPQEVNTNVP